jgi:hypothetical protein
MSESCREWRGDLAAAALDGLDPDAHVALQAHLDGCAACRAELAELTAVAGALPAADTAHVTAVAPTDPPAHLGQDVLDRLAFARAGERRRGRRRFAVIAGTALAAAAAIVGLLLIASSLGTTQEPERNVAFRTAPPGVEASAHLQRAEYGTEVTLDVSGLDDGGWYWLWLTGDDGKRIAAGTFRASGDHYTCEMTSALPLAQARRVWVTDEDNDVVLDAHLAPRTAES